MPSKQDTSLIWLPTNLLIDRFHPDNPREHSWENGEDLEEIKKSLIAFGWLTYPTLNTKSTGDYDYLLSGHGRVLVADNLRTIDDSEWWENEWQKWLKAGEREELQTLHRQRFNKKFWEKCPVVLTSLDDDSSQAALIRLNNTAKDGQDNPAKLAKILAKLPKKQTDLAGWDESTKKVFVQAYVKQKEEKTPESSEYEEDEYEFKEYDNTRLPSDRVSIDSNDESDTEEELSEEEQYQENTQLLEESESFNTVLAENKSESYNYDASTQSRFLVYLDKSLLSEFKSLIEELADVLGIEKKGDIHQWRSQTLFETVKQFYTTTKVENNE
jgi:hypothetical protein